MNREAEIFQELDTLRQEETELHRSYTETFELIAKRRQTLLSELASCLLKIQTPLTSQCLSHTSSDRAHTVTQELSTNEDNYDVILNLRNSILRFRPNPVKRSRLVQSMMSKIGPHRIQLFAYMLEHPGDPFHVDNLFKAYGSQSEKRDKNTFTKAIGEFRKAVGQFDTSGPYIVKQPDYEGITGKKRGYVYRVNPEWSYLVIRSQKNISDKFPP